MVRRIFWMGVGAGAAVFVVVKARSYLQRATPQAIGQRLSSQAAGLTSSARDFADRVRAASAEREAELREALGLPE